MRLTSLVIPLFIFTSSVTYADTATVPNTLSNSTVVDAKNTSAAVATFNVEYEVLWDSSITLNHLAELYVAVEDFNGDGLKDLLLGAENEHTLDKTPISLLINDGEGSFTEQTSTYIEGDLVAAAPVGVTGDFNGDGIVDVAIFDACNCELGQDPVRTGFYGETPILLLSNIGGKYMQSTALEDAQIANLPSDGGKLHVKSASAGDIDNDGDIDIYVESAGGTNIRGHFMINNGDGTFVVDDTDARFSRPVRDGPTGSWRYFSNDLHDMDGDGFLDLVLGQLRRINNQQDEMTSRVTFNDGTGHFLLANSVELPYADWNNTWTYAHSFQPIDLNSDGLKDLIFAHIRAFDISHSSEEGTGAYFQFLLNNGDRTFHDITEDFIGDQTETTSATSIYGGNPVNPIIKLVDMNIDGHLDIVVAKQKVPIGVHAPFIFVNNGDNYFTPIDSDKITRGDEWFGELSYPIDLNSDGLTDIVTVDRTPGPDTEFGTVDDTANVISILADSLEIQINAGQSGAWFNPDTSGQGVFIDVEPAEQFMFLSWFTYTHAATENPNEQRWLTAQGKYSGNKAQLDLFETLGGRFDDPQVVTTTQIGEVSLSFGDCRQGQMTYSIDEEGLLGEFPLLRVIPGSGNVCEERSATTTQAVDINAGMDGAWFDPNTSGQGFFIDTHPDPEGGNFIFVSWFTYGEDTLSGQRWLTAQGSFKGSIAEIDVFETTGGSFDDPKTPSTTNVGTMNIDFTDCSNAQLSYSLPAHSAEGDIAITRVIAGSQALCEELNEAN